MKDKSHWTGVDKRGLMMAC